MATKVHQSQSSWTPANFQSQTLNPVRSFPKTEADNHFRDALQQDSEESELGYGRFEFQPKPLQTSKTSPTGGGNQSPGIQPQTVTTPSRPNLLERVLAAGNKEEEKPEESPEDLAKNSISAKINDQCAGRQIRARSGSSRRASGAEN